MQIGIDIRSLMEGRHSGVEEYTTQIIQGMVRVAPQHTYHLFYNSARSVVLPSFSGPVQVHGFRYPNKLLNILQLGVGIPRWDALLARRGACVDVVFVPNVRLMPLASTVPLVSVVHDLSFEHFPELFSLRRRLWHRLMLPRVLLTSSDAVIAVSVATKRDVVSLYDISASDVSVVYSGVRLDERPLSTALRDRLPGRFVLYLGALEPRKNIESIVEAFSAIAGEVPHDLVLAGERGWLTRALDHALARSPFRSRIHRIGFVSEEDKAALYSAADLFVYPSLYEGFGFPPLEALVAGTPVVTSFNSALPEIVGDWATLVDPYDVAELAMVMRELLHGLPVVSSDVRTLLRERYSWDRAARETVAILERVA